MQWTEEQRELRAAFRDWGERFSQDVHSRDQQAHFSMEKWAEVRESGLLRLPFPARFGGLDRDLSTTMFVLEELGRTCRDGGLNFVISTQLVSVGVPLLRFGTTEQQARLLPGIVSGDTICAHAITEPDAGSDAFAMRTTARLEGDCFVLNGAKTFISNAPVADLFLVYAITDRSRGALGGVSALLVPRDTPGLEVGPAKAKMGLRTAPLSDLFFEDCRVPAENLLKSTGLGFAIFDHVMKWEILCSFIISVGEMESRVARCVEYAKERRQFGEPIGKYQSISHKIVDMRIGVEISRQWLYRTAQRVQNGENAALDLAVAKLLASEHNLDSAVNAVRIFGGAGYMVESGLEQDLRNSVAGTIYSGTSEIQRNRIAALMGL